mgnify:CR=1 FL=1
MEDKSKVFCSKCHWYGGDGKCVVSVSKTVTTWLKEEFEIEKKVLFCCCQNANNDCQHYMMSDSVRKQIFWNIVEHNKIK